MASSMDGYFSDTWLLAYMLAAQQLQVLRGGSCHTQ